MTNRIKKVNELLREEVSKSIFLNIERDDFITVTCVETAVDLKKAVVWVSILGDEEKGFADLMEKLKIIQKEIASKLVMKNVPHLEFKVDHSQEYVQKIEGLLKNE